MYLITKLLFEDRQLFQPQLLFPVTDSHLAKIGRFHIGRETGLDVKNIRYFGSQPWPYPSGLMVGFIADYAGGDIHLQDDELSSGNFYTRDHLPELPRKLSLARKMIDWWIAQQ